MTGNLNPAAVEAAQEVSTGIHRNIPNDAYHNGPGVSSSDIKLLVQRSPLHYFDKKLSPDRPENEPTPAMAFGTAYHTYVLEPLDFGDRYARPVSKDDHPHALTTADEIKARLKALNLKVSGKKDELLERLKEADPEAKTWEDIQEAHAQECRGKIILPDNQLKKLEAMGQVLANHPTASRVLVDGEAELSLYWTDPETGVLCKVRPDWLRPGLLIADLKTTADASVSAFQRTVYSLGYHISAAMYLDGYKAVTGEDLNGNFVFVVQETERPYAVGTYVIDDTALEIGRQEYRKGLELYARCIESGNWPGYPEQVQQISLPAWAMR